MNNINNINNLNNQSINTVSPVSTDNTDNVVNVVNVVNVSNVSNNQRSSFYSTNVKNVSSTLSSIYLEYPSLSSLSSLLELEYLRSLVRQKGDLVLFPKKSCSHLRYYEIEKYGFRFFIRPGFSPNGVRHRTRLNHACWFSKKPEIMFLTIREAMIKYPHYMVWIYRNLSINWSVYCIANFEFLIKKYNL